MAGTKAKGKKSNDAGELARLQKKTTAAWKEDAEHLFKYASDLCKSSPRLDQLAGLYLLLKRLPDVVKAAKANDKDKAKFKKFEGKCRALLKQQVLQASKTLQAQQAAAADGQKPSLVLAWGVAQGFKQLADATEDADQGEFLKQTCEALQGFTASYTDVERWLQQWADPALEYPAADQDDAAKLSSEQLTALLGNQVLQCLSYAQIHLGESPRPVMAMIHALKPKLETVNKEAASRDAASKEAQAAASKQQREQVQQQLERRASPTPYNQQQGGKRGKDADKLADAKRGKAGDDKAAQELQQHRDMVKAAQDRAAEVVKFLSESTLAAKGISKQQHLEALQSKVAITLEDVKDAVSTIVSAKGLQAGKGGKDKAAEAKADPQEASVGSITQLLKQQFGPVQSADQVVQQLQQVVESGSWLVFCEAAAADDQKSSSAITTSSSSSKGPLYFPNLDTFHDHVQAHQLAGSPAEELLRSWGVHCHHTGPGLLDAYKGDFGSLLKDDAAKALMGPSRRDKGVANGYTLEDNPLLEAFSKECPLKRYLYHVVRTISTTTQDVSSAASIPGLTLDSLLQDSRVVVAAGFGLLQLQRGVMVVSAEDLSSAPDWLIKAYHTLKLLLPLNNTAVNPDGLDFVVHNYFQDSGEQSCLDLGHILDPDLHAQATASAGGQGASCSGSAEPTFSDGLVEDSVTMLSMLHEAQALVGSPVRLALQLYSHKAAGSSLPLPHKHTSTLKREELLQALNGLERQAQLDVRSFLLQVLCQNFARLPPYKSFLEVVMEKRLKHRYVPVEQQGKGKDLVVSQEYYAQACISAAMPYDSNAFCCLKHTRMRELAEADGRSFSKYLVDDPSDCTCTEEMIPQPSAERVKGLSRYLLQPARVLQAMQDQEVHVGTAKGLHALTMELLIGSEYDDAVPPRRFVPSHRSCWDVCRFYLLLASQLAIHRQQLYEIVHAHEQRLSRGWWHGEAESRDHGINKAEKALLQQRVAGLVYCYSTWGKWFDQSSQLLNDKVQDIIKKATREGVDKAGKGGKDAKDTQSQRDQKATLDSLHVEVDKLNSTAAQVADLERHLLRQVDGTAAHAEALTVSVTDADAGMVKAFELLLRELVNPGPAPQAMQEGSLHQALLLSRMMLFELDVTIMTYVNNAHMMALTSMWRVRQPAAAVSVTRHALGLRLATLIQEQQMEALLMEEENLAKAAAKASAPKASSKKKKKKGPAQQQPKKQIKATPDSDEEPSDQEEAEAAAAAAADSEAEDADAQPNGEPDVASLIDPRYLAQDFEPAAHSSRNSAKAAAAAAVEPPAPRPSAAAAQPKSGAKPEPAAAEPRQLPPRKAQQQQQPLQQQQQQQQQGRASSSSSRADENGLGYMVKTKGPRGLTVYMKHRGGPTCWTCGDTGHLGDECRTPFCNQCQVYGHEIGLCQDACPNCGRLHPGSQCGPPCRACGKFGHIAKFCFNTQCNYCRRYGHMADDCRFCKTCGQEHDRSIECCGKCKRLGHITAKCSTKQCPHCGKWGTGCVPGCCVDEDAAASFSTSSSRAVQQQQQQQQGPRRGPRGPAAAAAASAAPMVPLPSNVKLLPAQPFSSTKREEFLDKLFAGGSCSDFAASLVSGDEEQIVLLMRVPQDTMDMWLQQPDPVQFLNGMLDHAAKTRQGGKAGPRQEQEQAGSKPPAGQQQRPEQQRPEQQRPGVKVADLSPEAAAEFVDALGPEAAAQLPQDWRSRTWRDLEACFGSFAQKRNVFFPAKRKAVERMQAAAGTVEPRGSSSGGAAPTSHWQPQHQPQHQQRGGEPSGPHDSMGSYGDADGQSSGDEGMSMQVAASSDVQQQQQQQAPLPSDLHAQWQHQQQHQHAEGAAAAAAAGGTGRLGAVLSQRLKQQGPAAGAAAPQPGLLAPEYLPPGASNSYSTPHAQLEQQQQQQQQGLMPHPADAFGQAEACIHVEPFESWMLWHKSGAFKAVHEFLPAGVVQMELAKALHEDPGPVTNISQLSDLVLGHLRGRGQHDPNVWEGLMSMGKLLAETQDKPPAHLAQQQQQQLQQPGPSSAAPPAAPVAMLPPHLRSSGMQQLPAATPALPPHLYGHPHLQQVAAAPMSAPMSVQLPAAPAEESESDDDDALLAMLGESQAMQQPSAGDAAATTWADITGQDAGQDDSASADFPPLGAQPDAAEDAAMQQALAASRVQQQYSSSSVPGVSAAGLANQTGEYNCFLNVVVQCLWNCKQFTQQVRQMAPYEIEHPVVGALLRLFAQMEAAETGWKPGQHRAVINPSELRVALASHTPFQCQEMNDANELLDTIYECFKQAQHPGKEQGSRGVTVDGVFGLLLTEKVVCQLCGKETHKVPLHYEHLVVVNSASLNLAALSQEGAGMDRLLFFLSAQEHKYCDKDEGGCGEPNARFRELVIGPQVLTLQLVWDQQVSGQDIRETLGHVQEDLDITAMYDVMQVASTTFRLTSSVAYYGQHYMAFVFNPKLNTWLMFDDASVSAVGAWQDVINKCAAGRIQPGVLFYQLVDIAALPDRPAAPIIAPHAPAVAVHTSNSSGSGTGGVYGHPGSPGLHHAAAASHTFAQPPAAAHSAPAAAAAPAPSALSSRSTWGAAGGQPRAAPQQPAAAAAPPSGGSAGDTWGTAPEQGWGADSTPTPAESGQWPAPTSSSGSFSSTSGPPSTGAVGAAGRSSSSGDAWAPAQGSGSSHYSSSRPQPLATGPGAVAAAGSWAPPTALATASLREVRGGREGGGASSTGPRAAGSSLGPRYAGGPPGSMERSGSGGGPAAPGRGSRTGSRGVGGRGAGSDADWQSVSSRGRGRGGVR